MSKRRLCFEAIAYGSVAKKVGETDTEALARAKREMQTILDKHAKHLFDRNYNEYGKGGPFIEQFSHDADDY